MPHRDSRSRQARARIADLAAQYVAEHGLRDYGMAKRKAARQLGLPDSQDLPSNEEVDAALLERANLFLPGEQDATLAELRAQALEVMDLLARFEPLLSGPVVSGAVTPHSLIELDIHVDSSKDFEQFLLNQEIDFKVQDRGGRMAYLLYAEPADVLVRLQAVDSRHALGTGHARLSLAQLGRLVDEGR